MAKTAKSSGTLIASHPGQYAGVPRRLDGQRRETVAGKIVAVIAPVTLFVAAGVEQSIAT